MKRDYRTAMMVDRRDFADALQELRLLMRSSRVRFDAKLIDRATHHFIERKTLRAIKILEKILSENV